MTETAPHYRRQGWPDRHFRYLWGQAVAVAIARFGLNSFVALATAPAGILVAVPVMLTLVIYGPCLESPAKLRRTQEAVSPALLPIFVLP